MNLADRKARAFSLRSAVISLVVMALIAVLDLMGEPAVIAFLLPLIVLGLALFASWLPYRRFQRRQARAKASLS